MKPEVLKNKLQNIQLAKNLNINQAIATLKNIDSFLPMQNQNPQPKNQVISWIPNQKEVQMKKICPLLSFKNQSQDKSQNKKHNISNKIIVLF